MRILFFSPISFKYKKIKNTNSPIAGGWVSSLINELTNLNEIEIGIVYGDDIEETFRIENVTYFSLDMSIKSRLRKFIFNHSHKTYISNSIDKYLKIIKIFEPNIIQLFGIEHDYSKILCHVEIPTCIHIQGIINPCLNKWFASGVNQFDIFIGANKFKLLKGTGLFHEYYKYKKRAKNENKYFLNGKYYIGRTNWDKKITQLLSPNAKYYTCHEILRDDFYLNKWTKPNNPKLQFATTINQNLYKGIETIFQATEILTSIIENFEWKIIGIDNYSEIKRVMFTKYPKFKSLENIKFCGSQNSKDLINILLKTHCFIHPSHIDNSPNSVCESMLLGMPIIATNVGGVNSLIDHKVTGILIPDGDPWSLADAILDIVNNFDLAIEYGKNARNIAIKRHDKTKIAKNLLNIFKEILK